MATTTDTTRYFKVSDPKIDNGEYFGRFTGKTPGQAANKAFTSILKMRADKNIPAKGEISFVLMETTRGKHNKARGYTGERKKLSTPTQVTIGDKVVTYNYNNVVKYTGVIGK